MRTENHHGASVPAPVCVAAGGTSRPGRPHSLCRRRALLAAVTAILSLSAAAQSLFVKAGGGLSSQWDAAGVVAAGKIALGYEYEFSQSLAIAPSIGFATRGWQAADADTPDMLYDADGNMLDASGQVTLDPAEQAQRFLTDAEGNPIAPLYSLMHRTYTTNYLQADIPLNYYVRHGEHRYFVVTAGVWGAVGIAGKRKTEGDGYAAGGRKLRYTDKFFGLGGAHRFDAGLKLGAGYQFPSSLTLNLEAEFGLVPTNARGVCPEGMDPARFIAHDAFAGRAGRTFSVAVTVAYRLNKSR